MASQTLKLSIKSTDIPYVLADCYKANITPLFSGRPGIGKTELVRAGAANMSQAYGEEFGVYEAHLASYSEVDIRGFLIPDGGESRFTRPDYMRVTDQHQRGILFFDEFMQAEHAVQKAVAPLILDRKVGEHALKAGWMIAVAGNGIDDGAGANELLTHVTNRIMLIEVSPPDVQEWVIWAANAGLPPELIAFAQMCPHDVLECEIPKQANTPYCTPRSIARTGILANNRPGGIVEMMRSDLGIAMCSGLIGQGVTVQLKAAVETATRITPFEVMMAHPDTAPVPDKLDEQYIAVMMVAVRAKAKDHMDAAAKYLLRFPINIALVGILAMINRDQGFLESSILMDWAMSNRESIGKFNKFIKIKA
jgi:hypothetical protein